MITRIVKLHLDKQGSILLQEIFETNKLLIKGMRGCHEVQLLADHENPNLFFTISKWDSINDLERYRNSDLFKSIWPKLKVHFTEPPCAWSLTRS